MRRPLWQLLPSIITQFAVFGAVWVLLGVGASMPVPDMGTLRDRPLVAAQDPATVALASAAHGCVSVDRWWRVHGWTLPPRVLMTQGGRVRVVDVPQAWVLAGSGWWTDGWCAR